MVDERMATISPCLMKHRRRGSRTRQIQGTDRPLEEDDTDIKWHQMSNKAGSVAAKENSRDVALLSHNRGRPNGTEATRFGMVRRAT